MYRNIPINVSNAKEFSPRENKTQENDIINVYYKLLRNATAIYNKNIEFKKSGYELQAVFERANNTILQSKNQAERKKTRSVIRSDKSDYTTFVSPMDSRMNSKNELTARKLKLKRKFNQSSVACSLTPMRINKTFDKRKEIY